MAYRSYRHHCKCFSLLRRREGGSENVLHRDLRRRGGTPVPEAQRVEAGKTAAAPATAPAKQGYLFVCWSADGTKAYDFRTPVTRDLTLRAKWQEEAVVEYWQVTWELGGGAWPAEGDNHATQVLKGGTLAEPAPPVKANHTFEGWYKEAALTNKVTFPYDVSGITADFTLYAKWQAEAVAEYWQVAWELNGGTWPAEGDNHATQVLKGGTLSEPAPPVKANHTFEGWYKEAALTNKVTFPYDVSGITADFTLYAKWIEEHDGTPGIRILGRKLEKAGNVTGSGISGTVYYDGFKELTLDNATIRSESSNVGIEILNIVHDLNINLIGTNVIEVKKTGISCIGNHVTIHLSIKGSGSLTAKGKTGAGIRTERAMLTIDGCSVTAEGSKGITGFYTGHDNERLVVNHARVTATGSEGSVCGFTSIRLSECKITQPAGAIVNNGSIDIAGNTVKTKTTIEPVDFYELYIAGIQVTSDNASDILGNGTASYDAAQKTLTLNNAAITTDDNGILNGGIEGLTIRLVGTNTILANIHGVYCRDGSHTTLTGEGRLTTESKKGQAGISAYDSHLTIKGCTVHAKGKWGISGSKAYRDVKLLIEKATVKATGSAGSIKGFSSIELKDCKITQPENAEYAGGTVTVAGKTVSGEVTIR